ncbi:MAG: ATP-binding protein [Planctomycetaceae bacterium]|nr:ATP-binding protein [Planctomycetaceae bacterium]
MPELVVNNLAKEYATRGEPLVVLRDVSLELSAGENVAILGPSGCGKSTLLHILGTLDEPTSGSATLQDQNPFELNEPQLAEFRNRNIGFIFQDHHLLPQLSVLENVLVPALADGSPSQEEIDRARELIERVGLSDRSDHRPAELSGGEKQRVAAARALIHKPVLLLADEPTGSLDRTNAQAMTKLLLDLQKQEKTMLMVVTHSMELASQMNKRLELGDGRLAAK